MRGIDGLNKNNDQYFNMTELDDSFGNLLTICEMIRRDSAASLIQYYLRHKTRILRYDFVLI